MVYLMAIGGEVCDSCVEGIDVLVEVEYEGGWLFCFCKCLSFISAKIASKDWQLR
jgi:hypothetical protein